MGPRHILTTLLSHNVFSYLGILASWRGSTYDIKPTIFSLCLVDIISPAGMKGWSWPGLHKIHFVASVRAGFFVVPGTLWCCGRCFPTVLMLGGTGQPIWSKVGRWRQPCAMVDGVQWISLHVSDLTSTSTTHSSTLIMTTSSYSSSDWSQHYRSVLCSLDSLGWLGFLKINAHEWYC